MSEPLSVRDARRRRLLIGLAALAGLVIATGVAAALGFHALAAAVARIGWKGLLVLCVCSVAPFALLGGAWRALAPGPLLRGWGLFVWARVVRDAAIEVLPFSQIGGLVIGARTAVLHGLAPLTATATTVGDVTTELVAQVGFTGLGVALLAMKLAGGHVGGAFLTAGVVGLLLTTAAAVALVALQRRGGGPLEALAGRFFPGAAATARSMRGAIEGLYARPGRLGVAVTLHLTAWIVSASIVWLALAAAGVEVSFQGIVALEALVAAVRSAAFFTPMGLGVQEAAYAALGPLLGLPADLAVALSLIKRGRDLAIGIPALLAWQAFEGRRIVGVALTDQAAAPDGA